MLLNYISSGLPELDVNHVTQMRMDQIIPYLMHSAWKKKYRIVSDREDAKFKSRLEFAEALDRFLSDWRLEHVSLEDIRDEKLGLILSSGNLSETFRANSGLSILQLEKLFNARIASRIRFLCSETEEERAELMKKYKNYYHSDQKKRDVTEIYISFLETLEDGTDRRSFEKSKEEVRKGEYDIYDAAAVALIWKRLLVKKDEDEFSQIIIDEAQDYGEAVYYALRKLMPACNFTVMGDVSQNIRYDTGMNDWEGLKKILLERETDSFFLLSKSYRNTIEISEFAGTVLEKAMQGGYKIQPVVRHGKPVSVKTVRKEQLQGQLKETVDRLVGSGYETIAVICKTEEDAKNVRRMLCMDGNTEFSNGVMVLPVSLTKGLEFDAVVLWKPDRERYGNNPKDAKLLYVAITRALHELHMILDGELTELLAK